MSAGRERTDRDRAERRKAYRAPKLAVHGDLAALTRTKKGTKGDGAGKPKTKASGSKA